MINETDHDFIFSISQLNRFGFAIKSIKTIFYINMRYGVMIDVFNSELFLNKDNFFPMLVPYAQFSLGSWF